VDTTHILFIAGGAFDGLEDIIMQRIQSTTMGFGVEVKSKDSMKLGEILSHVTPDDLVQYGLIPEFVGRFPVITTLDDLSEDDMIRILTEPKNALVKQYKKLLEIDGVELEIKEEALRAIARKAMKRGTGARALKSVFEDVMLDIMYKVPSMKNVEKIIINEEVVMKKKEPIMVMKESA